MGAERGRDRRYGASRLSDDTTRSYGSDKGMYAASGVGITLTQPLVGRLRHPQPCPYWRSHR